MYLLCVYNDVNKGFWFWFWFWFWWLKIWPCPYNFCFIGEQIQRVTNRFRKMIFSQCNWLKGACYKIIQNDRFSWKKNHVRTYRYDDSEYTKMILGYHALFFRYMHFKVAWNSILALKSAFIYDVIISCLKAWYIQLTSKNWFFSKDNYFYLHNSHISVNCYW